MRPRILYWFRTPPGVKVGRAALDEEAIRLIEAGNPQLSFNWAQILKGQVDAGDVEPQRTAQRVREEVRPRQKAPRQSRPVESPAPPAEVALPTIEDDAAHKDAAYRKLGSAGLTRLRGRYAELLARISDRISDPTAQEELKQLAERLNPDAWVTDADVAAALEGYEATLGHLRAVLAGRRETRGEDAPGPATDPGAENA